MKSNIKRLPKEIIEEGISVELVNSIDMERNYSPVQIQKGDEPVTLIQCLNGYWIKIGNEYLKDAENKLMVFAEKECRIGRARYLVNFGAKEKESKVNDIISDWKEKISLSISKIEGKINSLKSFCNNEESFAYILMKNLNNEDKWELIKKQKQNDLNDLLDSYNQILAMQSEGRIIELLEIFGIKQFNNPMLTANYDNKQDMKLLINVFGGKALNDWDGKDMLLKYAQIGVEKKYPI